MSQHNAESHCPDLAGLVGQLYSAGYTAVDLDTRTRITRAELRTGQFNDVLWIHQNSHDLPNI